MVLRRSVTLSLAALLAGLLIAPAMAADNAPSIPGSKKLKATRLQVHVNCQGEGDIAYGTHSDGAYGCSRENGAAIHCEADGNCEGNGPTTERTLPRPGKVVKGGRSALPPARN